MTDDDYDEDDDDYDNYIEYEFLSNRRLYLYLNPHQLKIF